MVFHDIMYASKSRIEEGYCELVYMSRHSRGSDPAALYTTNKWTAEHVVTVNEVQNVLPFEV